MTRAKGLYPEIPLHVGVMHARIYDRTFSFSRYSEAERQAAIAQATEYGLARQAAMKAQKLAATGNAKLTKREEIYGTLETAPAPKQMLHNSSLDQPATSNPYDKLLRETNAKTARLQSEKIAKQRRIDHYTQKQAEWNERHANDDEIAARAAARESDPEILRMQNAAVSHLAAVRLDPKATVADLNRAERLVKLANAGDTSPGTYWQEATGSLPPGLPDLFDRETANEPL